MKCFFSGFSGLVILVAVSFAGEGVIDIATAPYTISKPGSYLVVSDLTTITNQTAIRILCSDVTLDLNGHTLYGAGTTSGSGGSGIYAFSSCHNIAVYNGTVRDFRESGIFLYGNNCLVNRIRAYGNRNYGIATYSLNGVVWDNTVLYTVNWGIQIGSGGVCRNNIVEFSGSSGIYAYWCGTVTGNCTRSNGTGIYAGPGSSITDNVAYGNTYDGINTQMGCTIIGNSASQNGWNGISTDSASSVLNNSAYSNTSSGIYTATGCTLTGNNAYANGNNGIVVGNGSNGSNVTGNSAYENGNDGMNTGSGATVTGNNAYNNGRHGIYGNPGSTIIENTVYSNNSSGIYVLSGCQVVNNTSRANTYAGIQVNGNSISISQNLCTANTAYGLVSIAGNYFEQNKLRGNGTDESLGGSTEGAGVLANVIIP